MVKHFLLHLDESHSEVTRTWALTGICVPLDRYDDVRSSFYEAIRWLINPEPNAFELHPPELHAADLLREVSGVDDQRRVSLFGEMVDLVIRHELPVIRYGRRYQPGRKPETKILKVGTWFGMRLCLLDRPEDERFIVVMDGFDPETVREMSGLVRSGDALHAAGFGNPADSRFRQIVGEVFYADSRYSIMTQVADMIAYLRHVTDKEHAGFQLSTFGKELTAVSRRLDGAMVAERIDDMSG